jgi:predicted dehydrogenase
MEDRNMKLGIIGCGNISPAYFNGVKPYPFLEVAACADMDPARAQARAREFGVPRACTVDELLADPEIRIVVNLTIPAAHAGVNRKILEAGKVPHCEKPYASTLADGKAVLDLAAAKGLKTGCAPDTFLGAGVQTARGLVDAGTIGRVVAGTAFMCGHGHESWHPDPEFYYQPGGGPMLDMGPYYLTALVALLGPVKRVAGITGAAFTERTITGENPKKGSRIAVETPTHLAGTLEFAQGAIVTIVMSFDTWKHSLPIIELYGAEGSLAVPDPNGFKGPVRVAKGWAREWTEAPLTHSERSGRGIGVADLARAVETARPARCAGEMAFHVLEVMLAFDESSKTGRHVTIASTCDRPAPLPPGLEPGTMD